MKKSFLFASMAVAAGLTLVNVYTSLVDVPAWGHNIPSSVDTARRYYSVSNPGNFFRVFSPLNQVLGLVCLVLFWKSSRRIRFLLATAAGLYIAGEGMTFLYFYPRNAIIFSARQVNGGTLKSVLAQWSRMNWLRSVIIAAGCFCSALALHKIYTRVEVFTKRNTVKKEQAVVAS